MIRRAQPPDLNNLQTLFADTLRTICIADYTPAQIEVWASSIQNTSRWLDKIDRQYFLVYVEHQQILGFGSLESGHYIDMFYIHNQYQRKGIGKQIYLELEAEAHRIQQDQIPLTLSAHVSYTALPFFSSMGFLMEHENMVRMGEYELVNYLMKKQLS